MSSPLLLRATAALLSFSALLPAFAAARAPVPIVTGAHASTAERIAVRELTTRLQQLYPDERFVPADMLPPGGPAILVASLATDSTLLDGRIAAEQLASPESFTVTRRDEENRTLGIVAGADARGTVHAIYALLERLGCGFYLSYETQPPPQTGPLSFDAWTLADAPLFGDRIILNWHNFLSSATTWEYADWERYIDAAVRLRFNDLMVHAYGNNPMFTFTFNGVTKPVGYFATTQLGRDWGTQHVNDVRRMIGGAVFSGPVFGASIARDDPAQRIDNTTALMQRVFAHARTRGLGVTFALDIDTVSANPQEIIRTLPPTARFSAGKYELANPDTPEGYAYYKAQLDQLLARYPDITRVVPWFRDPTAKTPWRQLKRAELPVAWQRELAGPDDDVSAFALAKVVLAFRRALAESGRPGVTFAAGSWAFPFLEASDRHLPPDIPLIALDWWVSFDSARARRDLARVRSGRKIIPIVWAHHDDRTYIGRPYTPFVDFATKLERVGAAGFGIIHWTTRPLDLYFKSTMIQTWTSTRDQPLDITCDAMAARTFGEPARAAGGRYLFSWVTEAPMFGRETSAHFIDHPLPTPEVHQQLGRERLALLASIDRDVLSTAGREHLAYFEASEIFMLSFFETHTAVERAAAALQHGNLAQARAEIVRAKPEAVIEHYVAAARAGRITPGEQALIVSLNLRWLPHVLSLRQALGLEPARYRFGTVVQEPLAQGAHPNTFHFDDERRLWKVIEAPATPQRMRFTAISGDPFAPGTYTVKEGRTVEAIDGAVEIDVDPSWRELVIAPASAR